MNDMLVPSHLGEHQRLKDVTRYAATVVRTILEGWFTFDSVLDVGCGTGNWLDCFSANRDRTIFGLEMETYAPADLAIDPRLILHVDLGHDVDLHRRFDLVLCLEVAEHIDRACAATVVANCARHADVVLFSAAIPGQRGLHHVNEQTPGYWSDLFAGHDYEAIDALRPLIWEDQQIPVWYRQNMLLFVRRGGAAQTEIRRRMPEPHEPRPRALAHPEYLAAFSKRIDDLLAETAALRDELFAQRQKTDDAVGELRVARRSHQVLEDQLADARLEHARIVNSTAWRAFNLLRRKARMVPLPVRRLVHLTLMGLARSMPSRPAGVVPVVPSVEARVVVWAPKTGATRVVFVSGDPDTPGHHYRVVRYHDAAVALGLESHCLTLQEAPAHDAVLRRAGVIVLWRVAACPEADAVIGIARQSGARLVFDVDDLVFLPDLATRSTIDGIRSQHLTEAGTAGLYAQYRAVLDQMDASFCSTRELADHLRAVGKAAYVLPNGFDFSTFAVSRRARRHWRATRTDAFIRIGYAAGTLTHQRDFAIAAPAIGRVLAENPDCRLVLFRQADTTEATLNINEFADLRHVLPQIEWRDTVTLEALPNELARFDINIAPLETGNLYCEAKSELKFFESALVEVVTIASPTGPMARAIRHDETGLLADTGEDWYALMTDLARRPERRARLAAAGFRDVMGRFGPDRRQDHLSDALHELMDGPDGARALQTRLLRDGQPAAAFPTIPRAEILFESDALREAEVTVIIPLYNYAAYVVEALESVRAQTLSILDVIVIDDASTDESAALAVEWMRTYGGRFNRVLVLRNEANAGLALTRNVGFAAAETAFVLPLDADNRLLPACCANLLEAIRVSSAGFAYPGIQQFGDADWLMGADPFLPSRFVGGNFVDAMALIGTWAWLRVGGYGDLRLGWEDYDFWCRCMEFGIGGLQVTETLAEYRVHGGSMLRTRTDVGDNKTHVMAALEAAHPWLRIVPPPA